MSVRSNVLGETLGRILLEKRLITSEVLAESVGRMQKEKRHQGEILVEMGALSPFNLDRALVEQVEAKLFEVFSWSDGKFMFKAGEAPAGENRLLERSPASTILEGIRRHYDEARQEAVLEKFAHQYVGLTSDPQLRLQDMTSDPVELAFIQSIDGSEAAGGDPRARRDRARQGAPAAGGAVGGGHAPAPRDDDEEEERAARGAAGVVGAGARRAAPRHRPPSAPLASGQLSMMLQTVRTQDYFWALDVGREAPAAEIDRAYEALARSFHADRYRLSSEEDRKAAQEIFDKLGEAHRTLRDPAKRKAYLARLSREEDAQEKEEAPPPRPRSVTPPPPTQRAAAIVAVERRRARSLRRRPRAPEGAPPPRGGRGAAPGGPPRPERGRLPGARSGGRCSGRRPPTPGRAARPSPSCGARCSSTSDTARRAQHLAEIYAQTGQPDLAVQELERLLAIDPAATEVAEELHRLRTK